MSPKTNYGLWNRRLHYFLGLYFLFFIWLFALTGLLLNHAWTFSEFWQNRKVTTTDHAIQVPASENPLEQARELMRQLDVAGEIQWVATKPDATHLEFRVARPGRSFEIKADWPQARATVQRTDVNAWGTTRILHTFTGVRLNDAKNERDWIVTKLWAYSMDAVALGLIIVVISGLVMWWPLPGKRLGGIIALSSGVLGCGWFIFGLRWFTG
jgi:hypothetical protein